MTYRSRIDIRHRTGETGQTEVNLVFGRKSAHETHRQGLMSELGESYGHLRRAAGHLTHGTAERLTPTYDRAKYAARGGRDSTMAAVVPLYHQLREGANRILAFAARTAQRTCEPAN